MFKKISTPTPFIANKSPKSALLSGKVVAIMAAAYTAFTGGAVAATTDAPLFRIQDMTYKGGFRISNATFGNSSVGSSLGRMAYNPANNSIFISSHPSNQSIGEFTIPSLSMSTNLTDLPMATQPLQNFASVLNRPTTGNKQNIDQLAGMMYVGGKLVVGGFEYYDADQNVTNTHFTIASAANLSGSTVGGYYNLQGAAHTVGWMSEIPSEWRTLLGGNYLAGGASGPPITGRWSVGPSAFVFDPQNIGPSKALLDFGLGSPLHADLHNTSRTNDLWTHLSEAVYGFIVPGTRTYLTIGQTAGNTTGVGYKITQDDGVLCGGYCAYGASDYYNYYWAWDLNDLLKVKNGTLSASSVRPHAYGKFSVPFSSPKALIGGASYDTTKSLLYISIRQADSSQGKYMLPPVIVAFQVGLASKPSETANPNPPQNINVTVE